MEDTVEFTGCYEVKLGTKIKILEQDFIAISYSRNFSVDGYLTTVTGYFINRLKAIPCPTSAIVYASAVYENLILPEGAFKVLCFDKNAKEVAYGTWETTPFEIPYPGQYKMKSPEQLRDFFLK